MGDRLLILGASARAAAASARRAGLEPFAIDLFADRDTRLLCDCLRCPPDEYPDGLFKLARQAPPMPWMYTGGLENYPELVGELARERELWGNGARVLADVRDPLRLQDWCNGRDLLFPPTLPGNPALPAGRWLQKSGRSSGGGGVRWVDERPVTGQTGFRQEFVDGVAASAVLRSTAGSGLEVIGTSLQLVGAAWAHARPFQYSGSIASSLTGGAELGQVRGLVDALAEEFYLWGLWGIDFIRTPLGPTLIEVNPRYTASVEVIEFSTGSHALRPPVGPPCFVPLHTPPRPQGTQPPVVGKAIYYAPQPIRFPAAGPWDDSLVRVVDVWHRPDFADLPSPGDAIETGHPVLTVLTEADTEDECLRRLQSRAAELDRLFGATP